MACHRHGVAASRKPILRAASQAATVVIQAGQVQGMPHVSVAPPLFRLHACSAVQDAGFWLASWRGLVTLSGQLSACVPHAGPAGEPVADFVIQGKRELGVQGLCNLYGIESPGLTASLALAEVVANLVMGKSPVQM